MKARAAPTCMSMHRFIELRVEAPGRLDNGEPEVVDLANLDVGVTLLSRHDSDEAIQLH